MMKNWRITIFSVMFFIILVFPTYGSEYEEEVVYNEGRIEITFIESIANREEEKELNPVPNVSIEVYFNKNGIMTSIKELEEFSNTNTWLISDENGKIILENLPYGEYLLEIIDIPENYTIDFKTKNIYIIPVQKTINLRELLEKNVELITVLPEDEEEIPEIIEDQPEEEIKLEEETIVEDNNIEETEKINIVTYPMYTEETRNIDISTEKEEKITESKHINEITTIILPERAILTLDFDEEDCCINLYSEVNLEELDRRKRKFNDLPKYKLNYINLAITDNRSKIKRR